MWALMFMLPLLGSCTEIPEPVLPAGVGVNIHFVTGHEKDLDMIAGGRVQVRADGLPVGRHRAQQRRI